jgi:hypothetical protein
MAANPIVVPITPPRVAFLTPDGFIAREWYRFLLSLTTQAAVGTEDVNFLLYAPDTASALETGIADVRQTLNTLPPAAQDPLLLDTRQALDQLPPATTVDQLAVLQASIDALAASPASGAYSVASGVTSIANGGTGVSSTPANGQIDIGNGLGFTRTTLTAGTGASISNTAGSITISATGTGGTVTSVAALTLGTTGTDLSSTVANGTTTPVITLQVPTASAANRGALSAADWTTFNNKGSGSVTSVAQSFTGGLISVAGSPITTSGTLALTVAGTSGGVPYFASGTTWATSAALAANAIVLGGGAGAAPATTPTGTGVVTALGVNTGTAGAFVVNGGALGTPSSGTVTNLTGTASININGTVGATTPTTGSFTSLAYSTTLTGGTGIINLGAGQFYKDASGNVGIGTAAPGFKLEVVGNTYLNGVIRAAASSSAAAPGYTFAGDPDTGIFRPAANTIGLSSNGLVVALVTPSTFAVTGDITATASIGYTTGSGGAVTQITSRTTGVTLNKINGAITMFSAAGSTVAAAFTVTNSTVAATDTVILSVKSSTNVYLMFVTAVAAGSFNITFQTTGGVFADAPDINFAVIKAVAA